MRPLCWRAVQSQMNYLTTNPSPLQVANVMIWILAMWSCYFDKTKHEQPLMFIWCLFYLIFQESDGFEGPSVSFSRNNSCLDLGNFTVEEGQCFLDLSSCIHGFSLAFWVWLPWEEITPDSTTTFISTWSNGKQWGMYPILHKRGRVRLYADVQLVTFVAEPYLWPNG